MRAKKRGEHVFQEVSWNDALDKVAEGMMKIKEKYGPEKLALYTHGYGAKYFKHLIRYYGSPNVAAPSFAQCRGPREVGFWKTFGTGVGSPEKVDMANSRCITFFGCHIGENMHNTQVQDLAHAVENGAQLVVIDPRFSVVAGKARYWLPIKPGTDLALMLAWMHVMIKQGIYDKEYIEKYSTGFEELVKHVEDKTPEWAAPITGLDAGLITETAKFIASFKPASLIHPGRRVVWYGDDTQRSRAIAILAALLGSWGRKGGYIMPSKIKVPKYPYNAPKPKLPPKVDRPDGDHYPLAYTTLASGLCDATFQGNGEYDLKAWFVYGTNLIQSLPDPRKTRKALEGLDFVVAVDVLPMEICGWADVVLPECTYLERCDDVHNPAYKEPYVAVRQEVVPPMYDSKPGWWIAKQLAKRLGLEEIFPWKNSEEYTMDRLKAAGLSCDELRKEGVVLGKVKPVCEEEGKEIKFRTKSGKIELYSEEIKSFGFDPIPNYTDHGDPPKGMFRMLFGRAPVHSFGRTTNNRLLAQSFPTNEVWINADAAKSIPGFPGGVKTGDMVVLVNQDNVRSDPIRAKVTQRIRKDAIYLVHGFGHRAKGLRYALRNGAADSELITRYQVDPLMGGTGMNVNFVKIEKAG